MRRTSALFSLLLFALSTLFGAESITFRGGYTKMTMREGEKEITLDGGADVETETMKLHAETIVLSGENYSSLLCSGGVRVVDEEKGITVQSPSLTYNREEGTITIVSWVEVEDTGNEVSASGGSLRYDVNAGLMEMEGRVRLLRASSKGVMICESDVLTYDRERKTLLLSGSSVITWQGDSYRAHAISVNLESEEITMEGAIQGTVHG